MVWGTENGSSLTFAGTQNSNKSDGGAMNNKEVFPVFVKPLRTIRTPFEPFEPHSNPSQTPFEPIQTPCSPHLLNPMILRGSIEARTGFGCGAGHFRVTTDKGIGEEFAEFTQKQEELLTLGGGAGVARFAFRV